MGVAAVFAQPAAVQAGVDPSEFVHSGAGKAFLAKVDAYIGPARDRVEAVFKRFDSDRSGGLSAAEIGALLSTLGYPRSVVTFGPRRIIAALGGHDNTLSRAEIRTALAP